MHAVVEVFDAVDLEIARDSGARIIQVNARDLDTLKTDRQACSDMAKSRREGEVWIAASAMSAGAHLREAAEAGFQAVLMGTALMDGGRPGEKTGGNFRRNDMKKHSFAIKVCGITRQSDLSTAMGMGPISAASSSSRSPRYIAPSRAAALDSALIRRVGVFVNQNAEEIMDIMKTARLEFCPASWRPFSDCARRIGPEK